MHCKAGDKYIIEVEKVIEEAGLAKIKGFNTLMFDEYGISILNPLLNGVDTACYNKGMEVAWELAKKCYRSNEDGGFKAYEMFEIFGTYSIEDVFEKFSIHEAMEKYNDWKDRPKLKPCPYCGGTNLTTMNGHIETSDVAIVCKFNDGGCGASGGFRRTYDEAVKAWNERK